MKYALASDVCLITNKDMHMPSAAVLSDVARLDKALREIERGAGLASSKSPPSASVPIDEIARSLKERIADVASKDAGSLISDLQIVRNALQRQGARVREEITEYERLSQMAMELTRLVNDRFPQHALSETASDFVADEHEHEQTEPNANTSRIPAPAWIT
jgi:hypothetical protein